MALIVALLVLLLGIAGRMEYEDSYTYELEWERWNALPTRPWQGGE